MVVSLEIVVFGSVSNMLKMSRRVFKSDGTECGQTFNGKFTTNLKKCHAMEYSVFEKDDMKRKQEKRVIRGSMLLALSIKLII